MRNNALKFIKTLREVADAVERDPKTHSWVNVERCNCGLVAQKLLQLDASTLLDRIQQDPQSGTWTGMARDYQCKTTGLTVTQIFNTLLANGFKIDDFENLEYLSDPDVTKLCGLKVPDEYQFNVKSVFTLAENLVVYLRAWANKLCKEQCQLPKEENVTTNT